MGVLGERAIVVGGSIAGMAAAKVLSAYYRNIVIFDGDRPGDKPGARKTVPQGRHVHGLLKGGEAALSRIFPGITDRLVALGAVKASFSRDVRWYLGKHWLPRFDADIPIYFQTRPLLESVIRDQLAGIENVETRFGMKAAGYIVDEARNHICAVATIEENGLERHWPADLVIDASGRGGLLPQWLKQQNAGPVPEERSVVALGYASCLFRPPDGIADDWKSILIYPSGPEQLRGATLVTVEDGRWLLTLAGYHGDHPKSNIADFLEFARNLPVPDIYEAIKDASVQGEIILHKFPYGFKRRYNRMPDFPTGIFPLGDVNASLNPLFGQGMSSAFLQALALEAVLSHPAQAAALDFTAARDSYFKQVDDILKTPWDLALGEDFKFPQTSGNRPPLLPIKNMLKSLIIQSASISVIEKFYSVVHLIEKQKVFYRPGTILRIFTGK